MTEELLLPNGSGSQNHCGTPSETLAESMRDVSGRDLLSSPSSNNRHRRSRNSSSGVGVGSVLHLDGRLPPHTFANSESAATSGLAYDSHPAPIVRVQPSGIETVELRSVTSCDLYHLVKD